MPDLTRRSLLKAATLTATATALGWRPALPIGDVIPATLEPIATMPRDGAPVLIRSTVLVSDEFTDDLGDVGRAIEALLDEGIRMIDGLELDRRLDSRTTVSQDFRTRQLAYVRSEWWGARPA